MIASHYSPENSLELHISRSIGKVVCVGGGEGVSVDMPKSKQM